MFELFREFLGLESQRTGKSSQRGEARGGARGRRPARSKQRPLRHEMLERRELFAADLVGIARGADQILLNTDNDPAHEIDQSFGVAGDMHLAGDWTDTGHDNVGVVRNGSDGFKHWYLDTNGDPLHEIEYLFGFNSDTPVVGDWDGVGGDNVGIVRNGRDGLLHWYLDTNGDPNFEVEYAFGLIGDTPVTGDWNGDGKTDVGVVRQGADGLLHWHLNWDNDVWPEDGYTFGLNGDRPVVGDWNGDGRDDVGAVRTNQWGFLNWYLNTDRDTAPEQQVDFGGRGDTPLVGKWQASEVSVSVSYLDFGGARAGDVEPVRTFTIANEGNAVLKLGPSQLPAGFRFTTAPPSEVQPGARAIVSLAMQTGASGSRSGQLTIVTNDGNESPVSIELHGWVNNLVEIGQSNTSPSNDSTSSSNDSTSSSNTVPVPIVDVLPQPEIEVFYTKGLPGAFGPLPLVGPSAASLESIQDGQAKVVDLGRRVLGQTVSLNKDLLIVTNKGDAALELSSISVPKGFRIVGAVGSVQPGQMAVLEIVPTATTVGVYRGEVTINNNDADESEFNFSVALLMEAPAPADLAVSYSGPYVKDGTIDFNGLASDAYPTQTLTIHNHGQQNLMISGLQMVAGYQIVGIRNGQQIAPGGQITVSITPDSSLGEKIGTFRFTTNDSTEGAFSVDLRAKRFPANLPQTPTTTVNLLRDVAVEKEYLTRNALRIEITPAHGKTTRGTAYLITVHTRSGANTWQYSGRLLQLRLLGENAQTIPVENWTAVQVQRG
ncbi:MAG: choice-of-anchor D domain-containing protein [Planctomycetales bacterium]|nr:choice-of-anchor D domain-containing protein [Planctomycetales bacterium]